MNGAFLHLILNHIPVLITIFSVAVLAWGMAISNNSVKRVALTGFVIAGISILAVYRSGESAEEIVEELPGVTHDSIEAHEEAADISWWLTLLLGAGGAVGLLLLFREGREDDNRLVWMLLVLGLVAVGSLTYTAWKGGHIRHTEIGDLPPPPSSGGLELEDACHITLS